MKPSRGASDEVLTLPGSAGGLGAGVVLISLFAAATFLRKPDTVANWLMRETNQARARRNLERAERLAGTSLDYLDAFRVAGL